MSRRAVRNFLLAAVALLFLVGGLMAWLVATESGTRWLLGRAESFLPPALHIGEASGTLLDGIALTGASWNDGNQKIDVRLLETEIELLPILRRKVKIARLDVQDVEISVVTEPSTTPADEPFSLELPIELIVDDANATNIKVSFDETRLDIERIALAGELAGSDMEILRLVVESELGDLAASASARLSDRYDADANVTWNLRLPDQPAMSGRLRLRGDTAQYDVKHELVAPYPVVTDGRLSLVGGDLEFDLTSSWRSIDIGAGDERSVNISDGSLQIAGSIDAFSYEIRSNLLTADVPPLVVTSVGAVAGKLLNIDALSVWSDRGRLSASGQVNMLDETPWELTFAIADLDAALADARLSGSINARGSSRGRITEGRPVADVEISDLAGLLNGFAVDGSANLAYADASFVIENAIVEVGDNVARFDAAFGAELELDASLDLANLAQLGLDLSGSLNGEIRAATNFEAFEIEGSLNGADLAWADYSAEGLDATFALPRSGRGVANARITNARANDTMIDSLDLNVSGTAEAHRLRANASTQELSADAIIDAGFEDARWSGSIATLSITGNLPGNWRLQEPTGFTASRTGYSLDKSCLASDADNGFACLALEGDEPGILSFDVAVNEVPLAALPVAWPDGATVAGFIEGDATGRLADGRLTAAAELQLQGLSLRTVFDGDEVAADFERAIATAAIDDNRLDGQFELRLKESIDNLSGRLVITDVFDRQSAISGTGNIELNELALVSFFVPSVTDPTGRIAGKVEIAGSLAAPDIVGEIGLSDGSFGLARAGITVTGVAATLRQSEVGRLAVEGRARSGDGSLVIAGETLMSPNSGIRSELTLTGENFALLKLPDWQVTASPAITVIIDESEARVRGDLGIPAANITFRELPASVQKPSPDVVIHRDETEAVPRRFIVDLDVRTSLGDAVFLSGFGLTTGLEGSVRISGRSDTTYTSSGRVVLREGRYSAYGQELQIDSGELIFSGPLANPTLNVRASRTASDGTVAGILLTGTPTQPRSEVYSEPTLSDVEALSYLLTGRPLSNATGEQGDTLNQAAFALGLSSAGSVVSRVRNELGLETLGVQGSADSRQFFAGKRFGNRLFVEYAYGIVDNLGTLLLRYQLNRRLVVESRSGTVRTVDVVYSVKKP